MNSTKAAGLVAAGAAAGAALAVFLLKKRDDDDGAAAPVGKPTHRHHAVRQALRKSYSLACTKLGDRESSALGDTTRRIVCYGDSNTWGFDAFSPAEGNTMCRFGEGVRWPRVMAAILGEGYAVVEEGLNGRTTIVPDPFMTEYEACGRATLPAILHSHKPIDLVVIMLGTNDTKHHFNLFPWHIAKGAGTLVGDVFRMSVSRDEEKPRVLLINPAAVRDPPASCSFAESFAGARAKSLKCAKYFREEAAAHGCEFLDANEVLEIPDPRSGGDGIHLSADNCRLLGEAVAAKVRGMFGD